MKPTTTAAKNEDGGATTPPIDLTVEVAAATIHHQMAKEVATETRHSEGASRLSEMQHYHQKEK